MCASLHLLVSKHRCFFFLFPRARNVCFFFESVRARKDAFAARGECVVQADCSGKQMLLLMKEGERGEGNTGN